MKEKQQGVVPQAFQFIYDSVAPVLLALEPLMHEFEDNEDRISFLIKVWDPFKQQFIAMIQSKRGSKEPIPLEVAIRIFGARKSFDLITAITVFKEVNGQYPQWKEGAEPDIKVEDFTPFAHQMRERFGSTHRSFFELRITGLVFDILLAQARKSSSNFKKIEELAKSQFEQCFALASDGRKLAQTAKGLRLEKYMEAMIFLKRTGRLVMAIVHDAYLPFAEQMVAKNIRSAFGHLAEIGKFGISNNVVSCMLCKFIPGLNSVNAALLFYDYPFMMKDGVAKDELYELVSFCHQIDQSHALEQA